MALLPWLEIKRAARGFVPWSGFLFLALFGATFTTVESDGPLAWLGLSADLKTIQGTSIEFAASTICQLIYALISGIGVARLRPKPEAAP